LDGLKAHDPAAARVAMRDHLERVIEHLLHATETEAMEKAQQESKDAPQPDRQAGGDLGH
jgi:DNA-binding FadR family transcriptional regulator